MITDRKQQLTPEEYLAAERANEYRSEYRDGDMIAMPGASYQHDLIATNVAYAIGTRLRSAGGQFHVLTTNMRVWVPAARLYTYPDIVVLSGEPILADDYRDNLMNPMVLIEVLSPSTEDYDRGRKFDYYRKLKSLREYLFVSQERPYVGHYVRQEDLHSWLFTEVTDGPDSVNTVDLRSIGCQIGMAEIYERVPLGEQQARPRRGRGKRTRPRNPA